MNPQHINIKKEKVSLMACIVSRRILYDFSGVEIVQMLAKVEES